MTANLRIEVARRDHVVRLPNAALRFRPTRDMLVALGAQQGIADGQTPGAQGGPANRQTNGARLSGGQGGGETRNAIWYLIDDQKLQRVRVTAGITDGQRTQVESPQLKEGMQVIVGSTQSAAAGSTSPFQAQPQSGARPPGGF
jgi:HlyD family secretion protein